MTVDLVTNQWETHTVVILIALVIVMAVAVTFAFLRSDGSMVNGPILPAAIVITVGIVVGIIVITSSKSTPEELTQKTLGNIEEVYGVHLSTPVSEPIKDLRDSPINVTIAFSNTGQNPVAGVILVQDDKASLFVDEGGKLTPTNDFINRSVATPPITPQPQNTTHSSLR